jgi:hypothetical protein
MDGTMHDVWHRHSWLRPVFWLLARADVFFPESGRDVPAAMVVSSSKDGVAWRRTFTFVKTRRFNARMTYRAPAGVSEWIGPGGLIEVPWQIRQLDRDGLEITTGRLALRAGRFRLPIPAPLQVTVTAHERAINDAIQVELVLRHRLLGPVFGYRGAFRVRREAIDGAAMRRIRAPSERSSVPLSRYRPWFYAAAVYNLAWGSLAVVWPTFLFQLLRISPPGSLAIWQALGMMVLIYAPAYWWVARDPARHRHLVLIATLGKSLGPIGFVWGLHTGVLPLAFGLTIVTNDCLWWPAFVGFLRDAARLSGGWKAFLAGR